jgi:hypothetical protein
MSESKSFPPIIHIIGPQGSGKTTLCRQFLDSFPDKSVLAVDASDDDYLALSYGIHSPVTVQHLLQQVAASPMTREAMDWTLQDLPEAVPSESESEILTWGHLNTPLSELQRELLTYGLPRLFKTYDVILWDGPMGVAGPILSFADIKELIVITPDDEEYCQTLHVEDAMVVLSKAQAIDILPPTAAYQIQRGNWKFIGKLPPLNPPEKRIKELPQYFQDCFHKLDLPFELRSHD